MARLFWQQRQDIGPAPRRSAAMAQSPASEKTLLFGGDGIGYYGDTWEWDGEGWVQLADTGPTPRRQMGLTFDSSRGVVVLYGGQLYGGASVHDTWEWDGEDWVQVADTGPATESAQFQLFSIAYDDATKTTVLEGGSVNTGGVGTWAWDGKVWTQLADIGPSKRSGAAFAVDAVRQRGVLFGGQPVDEGSQSETWEWDGSAWSQVQDIGPGRVSAAMSWFGTETLLFGGLRYVSGEGNQWLGDTWTWDGKHWRERQDIGPAGRVQSALAWDPARERAVLFGGDGPTFGVGGDTWEAFEEA